MSRNPAKVKCGSCQDSMNTSQATHRTALWFDANRSVFSAEIQEIAVSYLPGTMPIPLKVQSSRSKHD